MIHLAVEDSGQLRISFITRSILLNSKQSLLVVEDETGFLLWTYTNTRARFNQTVYSASRSIIFSCNTSPFAAYIQLFSRVLTSAFIDLCMIKYFQKQ